MHISYANERIIFEAIGVIESMASTPLNFHNEFKSFLKLHSDFIILNILSFQFYIELQFWKVAREIVDVLK